MGKYLNPSNPGLNLGQLQTSKLPIVHVGFPKSASTTIQLGLFSKLEEAVYVSRPSNGGNPQYWDLYEKISHAVTTGKSVDVARDAWRRMLEARKDISLKIFSDERFTLPGRHREYTKLLDRCDSVHRVFGSAKVFMIIRHPLHFLRSYYQHMMALQFARGGNLITFKKWLESDLAGAKNTKKSLAQGVYFGDIARRYAELFGKENMAVFFIEDLKNDSNLFMQSIADFMGIHKYPILALPKNITANKTTTTEIEKLLPGFSDPKYSEEFIIKNRDFFKSQVQILEASLGIDAMARWNDFESGT